MIEVEIFSLVAVLVGTGLIGVIGGFLLGDKFCRMFEKDVDS